MQLMKHSVLSTLFQSQPSEHCRFRTLPSGKLLDGFNGFNGLDDTTFTEFGDDETL